MAPSSERHEASAPWSGRQPRYERPATDGTHFFLDARLPAGEPIRIQLGSPGRIDILKVQAIPPGPSGVLARLHNPGNHVCACLSACWCKRSRLGYAVRWYTPALLHRLPPPPASGEPKAGPPR